MASADMTLIYCYSDTRIPLVVIGEPKAIRDLVDEWRKLDVTDEGVEPIDEWLEARGVILGKPQIINLE